MTQDHLFKLIFLFIVLYICYRIYIYINTEKYKVLDIEPSICIVDGQVTECPIPIGVPI